MKFKVDTINKVVFIRFSKTFLDQLVYNREPIRVLESVWNTQQLTMKVVDQLLVCATRSWLMTFAIQNWLCNEV